MEITFTHTNVAWHEKEIDILTNHSLHIRNVSAFAVCVSFGKFPNDLTSAFLLIGFWLLFVFLLVCWPLSVMTINVT